MITAVAHSFGELSLEGREVCVEEETGHADHSVHRGPNLVTHGGQKSGLGFRGSLSLNERDVERLIKLFQRLRVSSERLLRFLPRRNVNHCTHHPQRAGLLILMGDLSAHREPRPFS